MKNGFIYLLVMVLISFSIIKLCMINNVMSRDPNALTTMRINPQFLIINQTGQFFNISVDVYHVTDLYGFEFKLSYDTTILDATNITEGPFLKSGGPTFIAKMVNETTGTIWVAITLMKVKTGVTGNGTLAHITFKATSLGVSKLDLYDTILGNSRAEEIEHETIDGEVEIIPELNSIIQILTALAVLSALFLLLLNEKRKLVN